MSSLPWDAVEGQIAVGANGTFNWFSNGKWHKQQGTPSVIGPNAPQDVVEGQVAVGDDGSFHWYVDGQWWTARFTPSTDINSPQDVVPGQVAVGGDETFHWSPGGFSYDPPPPPPPPPGWNVIGIVTGFSMPGFAGGASSVAQLQISADTGDPASLRLQRPPTPCNLGATGGVGWNGSVWVHVGHNAAWYATDDNAALWQMGNLPFSSVGLTDIYLHDVVWCDTLGLFVAVGDTESADPHPFVATSPDGMDWTFRSTPWDATAGGANSVGWSHELGQILVVGFADPNHISAGPYYIMMKSTDGINWTNVNTYPDWGHGGSDVIWARGQIAGGPGLGLWTAVGPFNQQQTFPYTVSNSVITSPDGVNWTEKFNGQLTQGYAERLAYAAPVGAGNVISAVNGSPSIIHSHEISVGNYGTWVPASGAPAGEIMNGIGWLTSIGKFIAFGGETNNMYLSNDGDTWTTYTNWQQTNQFSCSRVQELVRPSYNE